MCIYIYIYVCMYMYIYVHLYMDMSISQNTPQSFSICYPSSPMADWQTPVYTHKFIKRLTLGVNEEVSRSISNSPDNRILRWCRGRRGRSGMDGRAFPKMSQIARAILSAGIAELQSAQAHRCGNPNT